MAATTSPGGSELGLGLGLSSIVLMQATLTWGGPFMAADPPVV